jgi:hypothetical protein
MGVEVMTVKSETSSQDGVWAGVGLKIGGGLSEEMESCVFGAVCVWKADNADLPLERHGFEDSDRLTEIFGVVEVIPLDLGFDDEFAERNTGLWKTSAQPRVPLGLEKLP